MKLDSQGNYDVTRVEYTQVSEEAKVAIVSFKLHMNHMLAKLNQLHHMNPDGEIKRLLAMGMSDLERGTVMAVKGMTTEGFLCAHLKENINEGPKNDKPPTLAP